MMETRDIEWLNALVNHPEIRPYVGGDGELDLTESMENTLNHFYRGEHGGWAMSWSAPGVYEVHTFILPSGRGAWARDAAQAAVALAKEAGARHLWTKAPKDRPNVARFAMSCGFTYTGIDIPEWGDTFAVFERFI